LSSTTSFNCRRTLTTEDRETLAQATDKLVDGDSQKDLIAELKIAKAHVPLTGGDTSAHQKKAEPPTLQQMAFVFLTPLADGLHDLRTNPEREAFLHAIPLVSSTADEISLTGLENDLESNLAAVRAAKKARLKPTTGTVIATLPNP